MKIPTSLVSRSHLVGGLIAVLAFTGNAFAGSLVQVWDGYNDEPRSGPSYGATSGQPSPWYGSPNTVFFGNTGTASAYDPDENAIMLFNQSSTAINLSAASMGSYDLFSLDGVAGPVSLDPGKYVIFAGVDGSDVSGLTSISLTLGGNTFTYSDVTTSEAPSGVLNGASPWIGGSESIPWTAVYTPPTTSSVPDSGSTLWLLIGGLLPMAVAVRRRAKV